MSGDPGTLVALVAKVDDRGPYSIECPTCGAAPTEPCWDQRYQLQASEPKQRPHAARLTIDRSGGQAQWTGV